MLNNNFQYLSMALAYIEIGRVASASESDAKNTSDYQNAIAYQLYHATELFYKGMLSKKGMAIKTHDLSLLEEEYKKAYPHEKYKIEHPFDFSNHKSIEFYPMESELSSSHLEKFKPKFMDQHLRYPINKNTGGYSYSIDSKYFIQFKNKILNIIEFDHHSFVNADATSPND